MTVPAVPNSDLLCSDADERIGDSLAGTSATFQTFVLIEHRGSWSKTAADDAVGAAMPQDARQIVTMPQLRAFAIRPIGRVEPLESTVTHIGRVGTDSFLTATRSVTVEELKALPAAAGSSSDPLFAVCTNGSRDRCCALKGRPLAQQLHQVLAGDDHSPVVEISHLGGHRFASTMIVLPWGYSYGRLTPEMTLEIAYAAQDGLVHPVGLRGRADLSPAAQAAEVLWRNDIGPAAVLDVLITDESPEQRSTNVTATVKGRRQTLRMTYEEGSTVGETLCGGKPFTAGSWSAD